MAHDTAGCHLGAKKTKAKIKFYFTWPTIASDVQKVCECCHQCQKRRRSTVYDRTPITPIPRDEISCDILTSGQINTRINHCAIIHEEYLDFGDIGILDAPNPNQTELLPSEKVDMKSLSHLSEDERS